MTQVTEIRRVTVDDLPSVAGPAHEVYAEVQPVFDHGRFVELWTRWISAGTGIIFAAFDGQRVVGAIAGMSYIEPYSGERTAQEFFWFMSKDHRGGMTSIRLYKLFEGWCQENGVRELRMTSLANSKSVSSFYGRMGFHEVETLYAKRFRERAA